MSLVNRLPDGSVVLTVKGQKQVARAAGFDTYEEYVAWKERDPEAYERWYAQLKKKGAT